ncbi:MAG: nitrous oxide reductase accessory protein NosL [Candidatus Krumholzibacteria bacterium]|nr:nitrous oxide reductase accessory protein NosL [Candidatus Krumholzibacteria bacterium]
MSRRRHAHERSFASVVGGWRVTVLLGGMVLAGGVLGGCSGSGGPDGPPRIVYGEDACQQCFMIINDARYACGYTDDEGMARGFDDIGCMIAFVRGGGEPPPLWVADYTGGEWIRTTDAWFVHSDQARTPMGSGIVGVSSESSARDVVETMPGQVRRFTDFLQGEKTRGSD